MTYSDLFIKKLIIALVLCVSAQAGYTQSRAKIPAPIPAQLPVIPDKTYQVTDFGAKPDDGQDDTKAIQEAINRVSADGGGRLIFPDGVYNISVLEEATVKASNKILVLASKVALEAENSRKAMIRLADNQPSYASIFQWDPKNADDVRIKGLVIDANGYNNKPKTYDDFKYIHEGKTLRWLPRFVLLSRNGKRAHITDVHFTNLLNINTINIGAATGSSGEQLEKVSDITIDNCLFDNLGWQEYDFDHSTIYTQADRFSITNNVFKSLNGAGTLSARCAIEIHGSDQIVKGNEITGFTIGINVTGTYVLSRRQLIESNKFLSVARGVYFWSMHYKKHNKWADQAMLGDVVVRRNFIRLAPDAWLASEVPQHSREHIAGITSNAMDNTSEIENVLIERNTVTTSGYGKSINNFEIKPIHAGIALNGKAFRNIQILNNAIGRNIGPSIGGAASIDGLLIDKNKLVEPEMARQSENSDRAAILLTGGVKNAEITNNSIKDTENPNNVKYGIIVKGNHKIEGNTLEPSTLPIQKK